MVDTQNGEKTSGETPEGGAPSGMDPESVHIGQDITRRIFAKAVAVLGIAGIVDRIGGGAIIGAVSGGNDDGEEGHQINGEGLADEQIGSRAENIARHVEATGEGMSSREKALKTVDYLGALVFAWGIKDLLPGGHGHIHSAHYGAMMALSALKYQLEDEHGRHHLVEETKSSASAFAIIAGTIPVAEGMNADLLKIYESENRIEPGRKERIALMTVFASLLSPFATTVGSASIIRKMSNDFCGDDKDMMAACVSHVSNLSGFLLFGDPPFIAVVEKYGFHEGMLWQMKTMWPLALYSLFSATVKLNYMMIRKENPDLPKKEVFGMAVKDAFSGISQQIPFIAKIIGRSLTNMGQYFSGADLMQPFGQDPRGIEWSVGEVLLEKLRNLAKLPFSRDLDLLAHEQHAEGMVRGDTDRLEGGHEFFVGTVEALAVQSGRAARSDEAETKNKPRVRDRIKEMVNARNYNGLSEFGKQIGINDDSMGILLKILKDFDDDARVDYSTAKNHLPPYSRAELLSPRAILDRTFDVDRIKGALGHNLADVVDVFPFQAGCVPFLTRVFKDGIDGLDKLGMGETAKEMTMFFLIMLFSSMADNYVACKIGLELFPNKPHIPLIASIQGGSLSALGNMANIAQFSLDKFPLADSFKKIGWHLDTVAVATAYSQALNILAKMGFVNIPKPVSASIGSSDEVRRAYGSNDGKIGRRGFFGRFSGQTVERAQ